MIQKIRQGTQNPQKAITYALETPRRWYLNSRSTPVFDRDWDALIILDACRFDAFQEYYSHTQIEIDIESLESIYSVASTSHQWLLRNFNSQYEEELENTAYVTANPFSDKYVDEEALLYLDEVWKYAWDDTIGTTLPEAVTDRAISAGRDVSAGRLIIHYMQPHFPVVSSPELGSRINPETNTWIDNKTVWDKLRSGDLSKNDLWSYYLDNLDVVFESVRLLLKNLDYPRTIITADHGNGFGESAIYGHPGFRTHPSLRKVPWVTTAATDTHEYEPDTYQKNQDTDLENKLRALGYK